MHILIIAGGTGGHIFPALEIALKLIDRGISVSWLGTPQGLEAQIIPKYSIPFYTIPGAKWKGQAYLHKLKSLVLSVRTFFKATQLITQLNPDTVLAMGGFAAFPGGLASWFKRKRLVIHEQNALMGLTNRVLSHFADVVFTSFSETRYAPSQAIYVGNPVRQAIIDLHSYSCHPRESEDLLEKKVDSCFRRNDNEANENDNVEQKESTTPPPAGAPSVLRGIRRLDSRVADPLKILILGGSQGAQFLNQQLPPVFASIINITPLEIWHQTGTKALSSVTEYYTQHQIPARTDAFIDHMEEAYRWADLVISRAGATTIAELIAAGVGSILIPFPQASDNHQKFNADVLVRNGAAVLLEQQDFTVEKLQNLLSNFARQRSLLLQMAINARALYKKEAALTIIQELLHEST